MGTGNNFSPSLLDYARHYGLAADHRAEDLSRDFHRSPNLLALVGCSPNLLEFISPDTNDIMTEPKFQLNEQERYVLASSIISQPLPSWDEILPDFHRTRRMKMELPLFRNDENSVGSVELRSPDFETHESCFLVAEDANDKDNGWPFEDMALVAELKEEVVHEKLQTSQEAFRCVQQSVHDAWCSESMEALMKEQLHYSKISRIQLTSPLLCALNSSPKNRIPSLEPYTEISSDELETTLPMQQDDKNGLAQQRLAESKYTEDLDPKKIATILVQPDPDPSTQETTEQSKGPQRLPTKEIVSNKTPEPSSANTSMTKKASSARKNVSFATRLEEAIPDRVQSIDNEPQKMIPRADGEIEELNSQGSMQENAEDKIIPSHSIMRLDLPNLSTIETMLPRRANNLKSPEILIGRFQNEFSCEDTEFINLADEDKLTFSTPTCKQELFHQKEILDSDAAWKEMPYLSEGIIYSGVVLEAPRGLRIFERIGAGDDDEKLHKDGDLRTQPNIEQNCTRKRPSKILADDEIGTEDATIEITSASGFFSASGRLSTFMDTREAIYKKPRLATTSYPPKTISAHMETERTQEKDEPKFSKFRVPSCPKISDASSPRTVIIDSALLQIHRSLIRFLDAQSHPFVTIIYRDLSDLSKVSSSTSCCNEMAPTVNPDIILCPKTAMIFTPLQATTQRSLPGQGLSRSPVKDRIISLAQEYDRLFVLVTICSSEEPWDGGTFSAIAAFTSFCASVSASSEASVKSILTTSENQEVDGARDVKRRPMYEWTHALIANHGFSTTHSKKRSLVVLLQEETTWEKFLCRAGLNAFAAQIVLDFFKEPEDHMERPGESRIGDPLPIQENRTLWGLRAFVQMDQSERSRRFGKVIGRRAVQRLGRVLDQEWRTGGAGFRDTKAENMDERGKSDTP